MATLTWPASLEPASLTWHLEPNTGSFTSPLTRFTQTTEMAGARWVADLTIKTMSPARWRAWTAFLAQLRGQSGRVYVSPWHYDGELAPLYAVGTGPTADDTSPTADSTTPTADSGYPSSLGTPVVHGASQAGASLITRGWTPAMPIAAAGSFFHYDTSTGRTLHMVVADVEADASGHATLTIEPPIRTAPADGAALEIAAPSCIMRLESDKDGAPSFMPGIFGSTTVRLIEAF